MRNEEWKWGMRNEEWEWERESGIGMGMPYLRYYGLKIPK